MRRLSGFGIGVPPQLVAREGAWIVEREFDLLGPRPFLNWGPTPISERDGWTFAPMVYSAAEYSASAVSQRMSANDGETWLLLNEPERPEQANTQAGAAANMTRNFLQTAWATGREFQWAAPGVWIGTNSYDGLAEAPWKLVEKRTRRRVSRDWWLLWAMISETAELRAQAAAQKDARKRAR